MSEKSTKEIQDSIRVCNRCNLREFTTPIPGEGPRTKMMFVAEAPGGTEEIVGRPLVGLSGQLFDKILIEAGIDRNKCYITNSVKCRTTKDNRGKKNRTPTPDEVQKCKRWLWLEIQAVNPELIITCGKIATYMLLWSQLRKNFSILGIMGTKFKVDYHRAIIVPIPHTSFLLQHGKKYINEVVEILKEIKI